MKLLRPILRNFANNFVTTLGGLGGLSLLIIAGSHYFKPDFIDIADEFLTAVQQDKLASAHAHLSEDLQGTVSKVNVDDYVLASASITNDISDLSGVRWGSYFIQSSYPGNRTGAVRGKIVTQAGDITFIEVYFNRSDDGWKISSIQKAASQKSELMLFVDMFTKLLMWSAGISAFSTTVLFVLTARHVALADEFLMAVQQNDLDMAYGYLSGEAQTAITKQKQIESLRNLLTADVEEIIWKARDLYGNQCSLLGTIKKQSAKATDIWLGFFKEKNEWKIIALEAPVVKESK